MSDDEIDWTVQHDGEKVLLSERDLEVLRYMTERGESALRGEIAAHFSLSDEEMDDVERRLQRAGMIDIERMSEFASEIITTTAHLILGAVVEHERTMHGGDVCPTERAGALAFVAHVLDVDPDDDEWVEMLKTRLRKYDDDYLDEREEDNG